MICAHCGAQYAGDVLDHYRVCPGVAQLGLPPRKRKTNARKANLCTTCGKRPRRSTGYYCTECKNEMARARWQRVRSGEKVKIK